jgi:hypothetical protein
MVVEDLLEVVYVSGSMVFLGGCSVEVVELWRAWVGLKFV